METSIIKRRIFLHPKYLDKNIMSHLQRTIEKKVVGHVDRDNGHIISVNQILRILNNEDTFFFLEIEVTTFKPQVKQKIKGIVFWIFNDGIFVNVFEKVKILIPSIYIKDYSFNENTNTFENNNTVIRMGDTIKVEIKAVKYDQIMNFSVSGF